MMFDFAEMVAIGLGLASVGVALLIQCGGNKRAAPKKKLGPQSKSLRSSKSGKSKKSSRNGKVAGSKKSNKSKRSLRSQKKKDSSSKSSKKLSKTQSTSSKKAQAPKKASATQTSAAPQRESKSENTGKPQRTYYSEQEWSKNLLNELHVEMRTLKFNTEGSTVKLPIHNPTKDRYAFKVKCSDNCLFRVNPVISFVEPGGTVYINVSRCAAPSKQDRLVLETAKISDSASDPRAIFQHHQEKFPKILLPMSA